MDPREGPRRRTTIRAMELDHVGSEVLTPHECLELLGRAVIGRVGLSVGALPIVLPVKFVMAPGAAASLLRTCGGAKQRSAWERSVVAFEVDDDDPEDHTGWSDLVQGRSRVITDGREVQRDLSAPLQPWADPMAGYFVEISCDRV